MSRNAKNEKGFTLIEVCFVTIISGLLFVSLYEIYERYSRQQAFDITYQRIQDITAEITEFKGKKGRYPCPADRTLAVTDPNFGKEVDPTATSSSLVCNLASIGLTVNNCYSAASGITPAGTNGVGGVCMFNNAAGQPILVGAVPIAAIKAVNAGAMDKDALESTFDAWGSKLTYVVTDILTDKPTFRFDRGGITVHDENGNDTASIVNNGHFGIISHGPDRIGGYTRYGQMTAICGAHVPQSYNTGDDQNCANTPTFIQGIRNDSRTANHYDDITNFTVVNVGGLWAQYPTGTDMNNLNAGVVNIGTDGVTTPPPTDTMLNVGDPTGGSGGIVNAANNAKTKQVCRKDGSDCFDVNAITAPSACPKIQCTGGQVMLGITTDNTTNACCTTPPCTHAICGAAQVSVAIPAQTCPVGQWLAGIRGDGIIICK